ncbi:pseudouridine synthase [uncultured Paenalcaligenes sp.]|uniref:pseudouridine synthase n=1 Tax=uncultured Paenalcaligenes sp. TaxID=1588925 RepID=UPI00261DB850|nr:rRNA pseudouridine synthase [uncultured Paenalcaligenes sp.]
MMEIRISKIMADRGMCSRREADAFIERGWVSVDGEKAVLGQKALPTAKVTLHRTAREKQTQRVTIILNKPVGYVSGQAEKGYRNAVSLIQAHNQFRGRDKKAPRFNPAHLRGLAPAGRLDIDSQGLLVLTQDGRIARQLIGEDSPIDKEYLVRVTGNLDERGLALLNFGLSLDGEPLRPAKVSWQNQDQLRFVLHEGKKRQIRRMCELVGLKVVGLKRMRMGDVVIGDLPEGQWRYLKPGERFF